jgi:hypothetical protein
LRVSNKSKSSAPSPHSAAPSGPDKKRHKSDDHSSRKKSVESAKTVSAKSRPVTPPTAEAEEDDDEDEEEEEEERGSVSGEEGEEEGDEDEDEDEDEDGGEGGSEDEEEENDEEEDLFVAPTQNTSSGKKVQNGRAKMDRRSTGHTRPIVSQHRMVRTSFHRI